MIEQTLVSPLSSSYARATLKNFGCIWKDINVKKWENMYNCYFV